MGNWWSERSRAQKIGIVVAVILVLAAIGSSADDTSGGDGSDTATTTVPEAAGTTVTTAESGTTGTTGRATTTTTRAPTTTTSRATTTTTRATTTTVASAFGNGILVVGVDVDPGLYLTEQSGCYFARLSDVSNDFSSIISNYNVSRRAVVEISDTDVAFESSGCAPWTVYQPPAEPATSFGDGVWTVGGDIAAGLYESDDVSGCYYARLSGFGYEFGDLIATNNVDGHALVEISGSDTGFESSRCGTWTPVDTSVAVTEPAPFDDGIFLVGVDIAPGTYRADGTGCYYARLSNLSGGISGIITNNNVDGSVTVQIGSGDYAFESARCGPWTPAG